MSPYDHPELFDSTVDRVFRTPFVRKDRIKDVMKSYDALKAAVQYRSAVDDTARILIGRNT